MKRTLIALALVAGMLSPVAAAPDGVIRESVALCDPWNPTICPAPGSTVAAATFTRPANTTAYASGQLVANSTTAGSVVALTLPVARYSGGTGLIRRVRLTTSSTSTTNASFRVHFYRLAPTNSNGDGGNWLTDSATGYLGSFDITLDKVFTDGAKGIGGSPNNGTEIVFDTATTTNLFALVEARAAYTPTSGETFTVAAEVLRD